jgi:MOSC domain-containing protein YiiM
MRVISVNVGVPREIGRSRGNEVLSSILKEPVTGPVTVRKTNLEGDRQADLTVHGGEQKAVYLYPSEHYWYWKEKFPDMRMPWGTFGENLTTEGLTEEAVHVGDQFGIGTATFVVTKPRFPCFKLGMRFQTQTMIKSFLESERTGFYLGVAREGQVEAGDAIRRVQIKRSSDTIASIVRTVKRGE